MTTMSLFGATFIAFGPLIAMFIFTIVKDPLKVIIMIAGSFFWLLSLLLSSLLWVIVSPLQDELAFAVIFSVIFQELFRLAYYKLLRKADDGMQQFTDVDQDVISKNQTGYVAGVGFALMSSTMSTVNILADHSGPGTVGINGDDELFLLTSAFFTCCFTLLHTFWGVIFFYGMDKKKYLMVVGVVVSHLAVSCLTLLNQYDPPMYMASLIPSYVIMVLMGTWAYYVAGGSFQNVLAFFTCKHGGYDFD
uniref:Gamma-secretase subunit Aph-1-like protein n=1 Tax=Saccoglossus kowalevskii TaxID=10224 RepID=A0A1C9TA39_SACKO|nr:gamma-secretase subunit Aph-1-like protein [Saccoglossus kowalevskii]